VVLEAVGQPATWELAFSLVRQGGTVNFFGGCPQGTAVSLDTGRIHYEALRLLGSFHHTPRAIRAALDLLRVDRLLPEVLIQDRCSLPELPKLLPRLAAGGGPLKVAIEMGSDE
jgi:L-iditol 2-dehydrogenase